jgi:raffinose/stachyose/melibiose transport system permease protein
VTGPRRLLASRRGRGNLVALGFLALPAAFYAIAVVYPALSTLRLSFFEWDGLGAQRWVGLSNYVELFRDDPVFLEALRNTAVWTLLFVPLSVGIGLVVATVLNGYLPARTFFRALFYLPYVLSSVAVALIWKWMYYPDIGILDTTLRGLGLGPVGWLSDPEIALYAVIGAAVWQAAGASMVIFLAGLQTIPQELYEAAELDGANRRQLFRHVTIPGLRETTVVAVSLALIGSLNVFDLVYAMTSGGPTNSTQVLGTWMYFQTFQFGNFGSGAAIAMILVVLVSVLAVPFVTRSARASHV